MNKSTFLQQPVKLAPGEFVRVKVNDVYLMLDVPENPVEDSVYTLRASFLNPADTGDVLASCQTTTLLL